MGLVEFSQANDVADGQQNHRDSGAEVLQDRANRPQSHVPRRTRNLHVDSATKDRVSYSQIRFLRNRK